MIPADLLKRLQEADPELWFRLSTFVMYEDDEISDSINIASYGSGPGFDAILQYCLQDAIRARGWAYQVSCTFQGTRFAKIATINPDGSKWFHDDQHAPTEAEALLRAYLAAMDEKE